MNNVICIVVQNYYFFGTKLHNSISLELLRIILYSVFVLLLITKQSINAQSLWVTAEAGAEDIHFYIPMTKNTVIAGVFDQTLSGIPSLGSTDVYLLAIDSNEQQEWAIHIGSKGQDDAL